MNIDQVMEFSKAFKSFIQELPNANVPENIKVLRNKLLDEEVLELKQAMENNDIVEIADACGDIIYVVLGTVIAFGLQDKFMEIFNEIHKSNMTKLFPDGTSHKNEFGKMLKGPNFVTPNINKILFDPK